MRWNDFAAALRLRDRCGSRAVGGVGTRRSTLARKETLPCFVLFFLCSPC